MPAKYAVTFGLSGCYMPDSGPFLVEAETRRELVEIIRAEIAAADFPANTFTQARIRSLWSFIKRRRSSVAHFSITHGAHEIAFHGLTENEADEMREDF
jgi:hypothetical protein